jgi:thiol-disulfide isomerase/thioredoxin
MRRSVGALVLSVLIVSLPAFAEIESNLSYVDDITALTDQCYIQAIKLEIVDDPEGDEDSIARWLEGTLGFASGAHAVRITTESGEAELWVDRDGGGVLTRTEWERVLVDRTLLANVELELTYEDGDTEPYRVFLMWNAFLPTVLTFCRNSYRDGTAPLGDREVRLAVVDADTDGRYDVLEGGILLIDADGDGELLATGDSHERFLLDEPFNVGGTTYRVASVSSRGDEIRIGVSDVAVAPKPPLLPGFEAPDFSWTDEAGETISLGSYRGRVVVLDFWAGWCSPCIAELPILRTLVLDFGDRGVVVLGINLDRSPAAFEAAVAENDVDWLQVYDGSDGPIGALYRIEGIPMTYLIGEDGVIRARGLRGESLIDAVAELLGPDPDGDDSGSGDSEEGGDE